MLSHVADGRREEAETFDVAISKTHLLGARIEKNKELGIKDDVVRLVNTSCQDLRRT